MTESATHEHYQWTQRDRQTLRHWYIRRWQGIACVHTTPCCRSTSACHCQWTVRPTWTRCPYAPTCWARRWTQLWHNTQLAVFNIDSNEQQGWSPCSSSFTSKTPQRQTSLALALNTLGLGLELLWPWYSYLSNWGEPTKKVAVVWLE